MAGASRHELHEAKDELEGREEAPNGGPMQEGD